MPITVNAYTSLENDEVRSQLERLYDTSPEFSDGADAMEQLDDRSRNILQRRWLDDEKSTLHELAAEYNVSAERIRQLEKNAMEKIKVAMSSN